MDDDDAILDQTLYFHQYSIDFSILSNKLYRADELQFSFNVLII